MCYFIICHFNQPFLTVNEVNKWNGRHELSKRSVGQMDVSTSDLFVTIQFHDKCARTHKHTDTLALLNNNDRACLFFALINNLLSCLIYSEWWMELVESMDGVPVSRPYSGWPETRSQLLEPDAVEWRRRVQWPQCPKDPRLSNVSRWAPSSVFFANENVRDCWIAQSAGLASDITYAKCYFAINSNIGWWVRRTCAQHCTKSLRIESAKHPAKTLKANRCDCFRLI